MTNKYGINCMVTMQSWMFLSSFEKMRKNILQTKDIINLMHMENMVMGIAFGTAVTIFRNSRAIKYKGTYNQVKLCDIENNCPKSFPITGNRFAQVSVDGFDKIPGSPVAYWVSEKFIKCFSNKLMYEYTISDGQNVTSDNNRFVRYYWEVKSHNIGKNCKWRFYAKGGGYRKWCGNLVNVVDWSPSAIEYYHKESSARVLPEYLWYRKGITWGLITSNAPSFRLLPSNATFDKGGSSIFIKNDTDFNYFIGLLNSKIFMKVSSLLNSTLNLQQREFFP